MSILDKAEHRFGRFAIPGLIRIVAVFQFLVFILLRFIDQDFAELLALDTALILKGEVWRLITFVFIPRTLSLWIVIQVMFLWFINDGLEQAWGAFRLNLFFFGSMLSLILCCFLLPHLTVPSGEFIFHSLFFAFAVIYPDQIIQFMMVLPIKIKYLAYVLAGYLLLLILKYPLLVITITFSLAPLLIWVLPRALRELKLRAQVAERRHEYLKKSMPADQAFHTCASCGKTEHDDPHLEFRVTSDGEEFCVCCLQDRRRSAQEENAAP